MFEIQKVLIYILLNTIHCCDIYTDENEMAVPKEGTLECGEVIKCFKNIVHTLNIHECCEYFLPTFHTRDSDEFFVKSENELIPHFCNKTMPEHSYKNILLNLKKDCPLKESEFPRENNWNVIFKECPNIEKYYDEEGLTNNDLISLEQGNVLEYNTSFWPYALGFIPFLILLGLGFYLFKRYRNRRTNIELESLTEQIFLEEPENQNPFEI